MPTEQVKFFCAGYTEHSNIVRCTYQCRMCKDKEQPKFFCSSADRLMVRSCIHQCNMCKDKEQEMKMTKEQPLFLLVVYFNDGRIPHMERSNDTDILLKYGRDLLTKDSKAASFLIYKPMSRTQRAEFSTDTFD